MHRQPADHAVAMRMKRRPAIVKACTKQFSSGTNDGYYTNNFFVK
jgi:hypothetical protein